MRSHCPHVFSALFSTDLTPQCLSFLFLLIIDPPDLHVPTPLPPISRLFFLFLSSAQERQHEYSQHALFSPVYMSALSVCVSVFSMRLVRVDRQSQWIFERLVAVMAVFHVICLAGRSCAVE